MNYSVKTSFVMKNIFFLSFVILFSCCCFSQNNWQQRVEYEMKIDLDVDTFVFDGDQEIVYTNNSPDTIRKVYYHLFFNAFRPGSQMDLRSLNIADPDRRVKDRISLLNENDFGKMTVLSLSQNGDSIDFEEQGTILLARLKKPLLPGKKTAACSGSTHLSFFSSKSVFIFLPVLASYILNHI